MRARYHGEQPSNATQLIFEAALTTKPPTVGFMFGNLADAPENRLPENQATIEALRALGIAMAVDPSNEQSKIPAVYTYFGQFIDHDITNIVFDNSVQVGGVDAIQAATFKPILKENVPVLVHNERSATLDLDSVYGGLANESVQPDGTFKLGKLTPVTFGPITTGDNDHDLPRRPIILNPVTDQEKELDRQALIGDPRNDENLLVAQLHVAFLRSHNALLHRNKSDHNSTKTEIRRRYQWAVLHDFLPTICDKAVIQDVLDNGPSFWKVNDPTELFIPLEFSAAAYRFGHSMIRGSYSHNSTFSPPPGKVVATFNFFFTFTALSGDLQPGSGADFQFPSLPNNWPIEWHRFFDTNINAARKIDANLTPELGNLRDFQGMPIQNLMSKLAARNLLRGYLLGLPTGQAVADLLAVPRLSAQTLIDSTPSGLKELVVNAGLIENTPLWFYILAEAGDPDGPNGNNLGPVGSRIVAETLWNLINHSEDSVIKIPPSTADLATNEFSLKGLIKIGQDTAMIPL